MKNSLMIEFSVDKENNTIIVQREFAAQLPLVWDAFTKSEILDKWWAPRPWQARTKTMDFREGGYWHYAMVGPEGEEHWGMMRYKTIQPQKGFLATDVFADAEGNVNEALPQAKWQSTFEDKGTTTLVIFHTTYDDLAQLETVLQMGMQEGLTAAMEGLDEIFASQNK